VAQRRTTLEGVVSGPACRSCDAPLTRTFLDLGNQPLANSYLTTEQLAAGDDAVYPLHARVCDSCRLVQIEAVVTPEAIFSDYAYFSSYSDSWVAHAQRYAADAIARLGLGPGSLVVEIASNDGYLLRHFVAAGVPVLGIEPAANVAEVAIASGIPTDVRFFGRAVAEDVVADGRTADLVVANNVLAHVPGLNDFVSGVATLLADDGVFTVEAPHLLELIQQVQFDTIYHEHLCYFSLLSLRPLFERHGLRIFDVERLSTHGGSLRLWAARAASEHPTEPSVQAVLDAEIAAGLAGPDGYAGFAPRVADVTNALHDFLAAQRAAARSVAAYGAAAKGNTLLNTAGVSTDDVAFVVDRNPHKQGHYLPGSHLPILGPEAVRERRPDALLILPWNLRDEITAQMAEIRSWGGRFVVPIPQLVVLD
jgi:SAM-dependent methyltransferase